MVIIRQMDLPTTGIHFQDVNVDAYIGDEVLGKGSLFITEEVIMWVKPNGHDGFTIQYKKMTLHAISRDPNMHPRGCLYLMVNGSLDEDINDGNKQNGRCLQDVTFEVERMSLDAAPSADDDEDMTELRFVPEDQSRLEEMYKAIQDCTLLHPDASSDMSEPSEESEEPEEQDLYELFS